MSSLQNPRWGPLPAWLRGQRPYCRDAMPTRGKAGAKEVKVRKSGTRAALRRAQTVLLALGAAAGSLMAAPAQAQSFYESSGRSYFFGMGGTQVAVPGATVDVATGALLVKFPLLPLPSRYPHQVALYFNSQDGSFGPTGRGSALSTSVFLATGPSGGVDLILPGHRRFEFVYNWATGAYADSRDPEMLGAQIVQGPGQYGLAGTLTLRNGDQWQFDNQGNCTAELDRHGNFVNLDGAPFTQAVRYGGWYYPRADFAYTNGLLTQITYTYTTSNPPARSWTLAYDASNRLSSISDPQGHAWHYTWTTYTRADGQVLPLISTITSPRGNVILSAQYDTSGRITQYTAADTGVTHFAYSAALGADGTTTVTDPLNHATAWSYTWPAPPAGETAKFGYRLTSTVDPLGRQTQFAATHTGSNLITQITDYRGRITTQNWDWAEGNLLSRTSPTASGGTATASWTYATAYNMVSSATDRLGRQTTATIDPSTGNTTQTTDARQNSTTYGYDGVTGDLTRTTNPLGQNRYVSYDSFGDLLSVSDGTTTLYSATYDSAARKTSETDANGKTTSYTYDSLDRLVSVSRTVAGQAVTTTFQYDADSNRTQLTDPNTHTWSWSFDAMDRVSGESNPLAQSTALVYDLAGNLQTRTDRKGQQWVFTFDAANRPLTKTFKRADGSTESTVTYTYDPTTKLLTSVNDSAFGTTSWTYDSLDRPYIEAGPNGTLTSTLNPAIDRREGLQAASQAPISYGFDANDNVVAIAQSGTTSISYDALNRPSVRTLPSGVNTTWSYDPHGFVSGIVSKLPNGAAHDTHFFTRDAVGNITVDSANAQNFTYGYDDLYRLTSASVLGTSYSWVYDKAGNRTQQIAGGVTTNATYNAADQLATVNGVAVTHDLNGAVTADEAGGAYTWDVRGRLVGLTRNGVSASFGYNQDDLRVNKTVGGVQTTYLLDGDSVVRESKAGVTTDLLQGPGTDDLLMRGGNWFTPRSLGSASTITDGSGTWLQRYDYAPFGQVAVNVGSGAAQPFNFTGREADETGLMYYRARYYNPGWGRFVSEDPVGFAQLLTLADEIGQGGSLASGNPLLLLAARQLGTKLVSAAPSLINDALFSGATLKGLAGFEMGANPFLHVNDNPVCERDPSGTDLRSWWQGQVLGFQMWWNSHFGGGPRVPRNRLTGRPFPTRPTGTNGGSQDSQPPGNEGTSRPGPRGNGGGGGSGRGGGESGGGGGGYTGGAGRGGGAGGGGCFVAGTPVVMADGTSKPIEAVKVGDLVLSRDPTTRQTSGQQVYATPVHVVSGSIVLRFSNGECVETTCQHRFYVPGKGFITAGKLEKRTRVARWKGKPLRIAKITVNWSATRTVYNLTVANFHTYFVGHSGIWVHNIKGSSAEHESGFEREE